MVSIIQAENHSTGIEQTAAVEKRCTMSKDRQQPLPCARLKTSSMLSIRPKRDPHGTRKTHVGLVFAIPRLPVWSMPGPVPCGFLNRCRSSTLVLASSTDPPPSAGAKGRRLQHWLRAVRFQGFWYCDSVCMCLVGRQLYCNEDMYRNVMKCMYARAHTHTHTYIHTLDSGESKSDSGQTLAGAAQGHMGHR